MADDKYNNGHCDDPVHKVSTSLDTRFGGANANPRNNKGRPLGSKNKNLSMAQINNFYMREAHELVKVNDKNGEVLIPKYQAMVRQMLNMAAKGNVGAMRLAVTTMEKAISKSDKDRHEFILGWVSLTERLVKSRRNQGSLDHFNAMHDYFMFKKDIRRVEGKGIWIYEDNEPLTEEDWHHFHDLHEQLKSGKLSNVPWPVKYPSDNDWTIQAKYMDIPNEVLESLNKDQNQLDLFD